MLDYKVIYRRYSEDLVKDVNTAISEGWKPQGGVSAESSNCIFMQAMVREVTNNTTTGEVR